MQFEFCSLCSGSKGNAALIRFGETRLLVDAGVSCRALETALRDQGVRPEELRAVLVTHEHSDHIRGLPVFAKKYGICVYASCGTWAAMEKQVLLSARQRMEFEPDQDFYIDNVNVTPFSIPHDTPMPVGYCLEALGKKVCFATDLGHTTSAILDRAAHADVLLLEANHDVELLKNGPYPYALKKRILGRYGHLSNDACAVALESLLPTGVKRVFLGHLSQENNKPELALETAQRTAQRLGARVDDDVFLRLTYPDRAAEAVRL